ncbi:MAG: thioredoxin family protein [Sedimentisphaerales bacterium]|nr:thioredoxin family protein [Sedimentisphaerales bacterium]
MKESTKNFLILFVVLCAVVGVVAVRQYRQANAMAEMGKDVAVGAGTAVLLELGSHSCIPCKQMMPILEELSTEYKDHFDVKFIDVYQDRDAVKKYGIEKIPTQIFFGAQGQELFRHVGFYPKEDILAKWKELGIALEPSK